MTRGIHHISAIASDAQKTIDFYTGILGLRLVKQTVNQDAPDVYHLFFGDALGHPGMDLTFFIFTPSRPGVPGNGIVSKISLAVPMSSLSFWKKRLDTFHIEHSDITTSFNHKKIICYDYDHLELELVEIAQTEDVEETDAWHTKDVTKEHAILQFYSATLQVEDRRLIEPVITTLFGYTAVDTNEAISLYKTTASSRANYLEILETPSSPVAINAAGTVHHIAFRTSDAKEQETLREKIFALGLYPTDVIDRFYFKSVYFRTPAGILFEIATDGPGFTADQAEQDLGTTLSLPPFLQPFRNQIEKNLPKLNVKNS